MFWQLTEFGYGIAGLPAYFPLLAELSSGEGSIAPAGVAALHNERAEPPRDSCAVVLSPSFVTAGNGQQTVLRVSDKRQTGFKKQPEFTGVMAALIDPSMPGRNLTCYS